MVHRTLRIAAVSFLTGFSGAMMPGPMLVLVIGQTFVVGFGAVLAICAGHALLELLTVLLLIAGVRSVIERVPVRAAIGCIGGAALAYFGIGMIRSAAAIALAFEANGQQPLPLLRLVLAGAAVCAANPYFLGWWATVGSGQLAHAAPTTFGELVAFYIGHELSDVVWYSLVGILVVWGRQSIPLVLYRGLVAACGWILLALALWFIISACRIAMRNEIALKGDPAE